MGKRVIFLVYGVEAREGSAGRRELDRCGKYSRANLQALNHRMKQKRYSANMPMAKSMTEEGGGQGDLLIMTRYFYI